MEKTGLTAPQVQKNQEQYGLNILFPEKKENLIKKILEVVCEPMFLLLLSAATIYFVLGEPRDGIIMLVFVLFVIGIETFQEWKTDKTLHALKDLSSPKIKVIRDGIEMEIESKYLTISDIMIIFEGVKIPADGLIIESKGICIDESSLTGESEGKWKKEKAENAENEYFREDYCYAGTIVLQGYAKVLVTQIGKNTEYGKIGKNILNKKPSKTPLEKEINRLVKFCAIAAIALLLIVAVFTFIILIEIDIKDRIIQSILSAVTLAMAMIPEEFPVILAVFLSMGAWRLAKKNSLVRKLPSVETLGAVSVLCVDKTGTITKNQMEVSEIWTTNHFSKENLLRYATYASEQNAFDSMEIAIFNAYNSCINRQVSKPIEIIKSFPFTNETKMMANILNFEDSLHYFLKGASENVLKLCDLTGDEQKLIKEQVFAFSKKGLRVLAVATKKIDANVDSIFEKSLDFVGLLAFVDPPREEIADNIEKCYRAGIRVIMITGDYGQTASSIARRVGIKNPDHILNGSDIEVLTDLELQNILIDTNIFSRVIPEHKMRIVKSLQAMGEIVAMTGDGVNDAPALKYADIGIAMGKKGNDVSKEAADLILLDDNFSTIVTTIEDGRRIYDNIRKAIGYVFAIHIPIALASLMGLILGILPENLFLLPLHIVLMELLIDPSCSIVLERQKSETELMSCKPRKVDEKILTKKFLAKSIIQGFMIFLVSFGAYYYYLFIREDVFTARSMGIAVLFISNILLVNVNASSTKSIFSTFKALLRDKVMWVINSLTFIILFVILYSPMNQYLKLDPLFGNEFIIALLLSMMGVLWIEIVKFFKRKNHKCNMS